MQTVIADTLEKWRTAARRLLATDTLPSEVQWIADATQAGLFDSNDDVDVEAGAGTEFTVPKTFLEMCNYIACHRDPSRWDLLYRVLWRLTHGERHLLQITTDDDVYTLVRMHKAVTRDVHKMKAFVRFRKVTGIDSENYIAWHRPDHRILRLAAPFFARRFKGIQWSILTPDESVAWDLTRLIYLPGVPVTEAPTEDVLEDLWKTYYASIFNPARVKIASMKREMPVRHWPTLPEATMIAELLEQAPGRVMAMIEKNEGFASTAARYLPAQMNLKSLRKAADCCQACDLYKHATQTVFGEGPANAQIVFVGEQPGDREDVEGHPFVGPAGKLLDEALENAGIERDEVYITNVVKHFKFTESETARGKRRIHQKPDSREIFACRPWLEAELATIQPTTVVCLGATSAQALFGRDFRITKSRGQMMETEWCTRSLATWHPSAILRMPDQARREEMKQQLFTDLALIHSQ